MSSAPRFENQQVVNSFNLFIDSERCVIQGDKQSKGDDVHIQFECNSVEAQDGEVIKLTLTELTMPNTLTMVDLNNSRGLIKATSTFKPVTAPAVFGLNQQYDMLDRQNYDTIYDVALSFALNMKRILDGLVDPTLYAFTIIQMTSPSFDTQYVPSSAVATGTGATLSNPAYLPKNVGRSPIPMGSTFLRQKFECRTITTSPPPAAAAHGISSLKIQLKPEIGDIYSILGGNRLDTESDTFTSLQVDITTNQIEIIGWYPMMRYTDPNIYLRASSTGQNGLEMSVLQAGVLAGGNANIADIVTSDILGKFNRYGNGQGSSEYIHYISSNDEYFLNLQQRKLTSLRLFLTDSKGRKVGRLTSDTTGGTAAGRETAVATDPPTFAGKLQNELGNLYFSAVIRIDVVKANCPVKLDTVIFPPPANASKAAGVLPYTGFTNRPNY